MMSIFNRLALSTMKVTIMSTNGRLSTNEPEDRRRVRTRQMLRNALLELIDEKGYESVTVQEITDRADLGRATFYLHFKDKDELLVATFTGDVRRYSGCTERSRMARPCNRTT
jgi:AcrR family transcriptional regulator